MTERVDKQWKNKGLSAYPTEAILETLRHYGVEVEEQGFASLAPHCFPLDLGNQWANQWKGKGQFADFPWAAADELWRRWQPNRLAPSVLAEALLELIRALQQMLQDEPSAPVGPALAKLGALRSQVPLEEGKPDSRFVEELSARMGEAERALSEMPPLLAREGHIEDAEASADIFGFLYPERAKAMALLVRAAKGENEQVVGELEALLDNSPIGEAPALLDVLIQLEALEPARKHATQLFDRAEKDDEFHLAMEIGERLAFLLDRAGDRSALGALNQRLEKVHKAHAAAHSHF